MLEEPGFDLGQFGVTVFEARRLLRVRLDLGLAQVDGLAALVDEDDDAEITADEACVVAQTIGVDPGELPALIEALPPLRVRVDQLPPALARRHARLHQQIIPRFEAHTTMALRASRRPAPPARVRSSLSAGRPRAAASVRRGGDSGDSGDDGPSSDEPPRPAWPSRAGCRCVPNLTAAPALRAAGFGIRAVAVLPRKEAAMSRHRPPRRRRADHRPLRPIEPPAWIAIALELLGACWACDAPVTHTPSGLCSVEHRPGCRLAAEVERAA